MLFFEIEPSLHEIEVLIALLQALVHAEEVHQGVHEGVAAGGRCCADGSQLAQN